jgi:hypothetical protein
VEVSPDGNRVYIAHWQGGLITLDNSELAANKPNPQLRLISKPVEDPLWRNTAVHSAETVPGRQNLVITQDEVVGNFYSGLAGWYDNDLKTGCPYGWAHLIDTSSPRPKVLGEFKIAENAGGCNDPARFMRPPGFTKPPAPAPELF